jgi:hypothetical protein
MFKSRLGLAGALAAGCCSALALVSASGATNYAPLVVAQTNGATIQTALQGSMATPVLLISNFSTAAGAYGLSVNGNSSSAPAIGGGNGGTGIGFRGLSVGGVGALGIHTSSTGAAAGVEGETNSTVADAVGVLGRITSTSPGSGSVAVRGINNDTGVSGYGVWGSQAGFGVGVSGTSPSGLGVYGSSPSGTGVYGSSSSGDGVYGSSPNGNGVYGSSPNGVGVYGYSTSNDAVQGHGGGYLSGVAGFGTNGFGIYGESTNSYAGYFAGNVTVTGTLSKGAGMFKIDHPLDPASKYLQHSFVESPDMLDVYNGNAVTDDKGFATVTLPRYFQALNRSFRYQLTIVGTRGWNARVVKEIAHNRFSIQSDQPQVKVSWQVTGIRHDRYADSHRINVVVPKSGADEGRYLHPELYGQPKSKAIDRAPAPQAPRPLQAK